MKIYIVNAICIAIHKTFIVSQDSYVNIETVLFAYDTENIILFIRLFACVNENIILYSYMPIQ